MHTRSAAAHVSGAKTLKIHTSGQYQDAEGQTSCKVCPKGKYIGGTSSMDATGECGSIECITCPSGQAASKIASTTCDYCENGVVSMIIPGVVYMCVRSYWIYVRVTKVRSFRRKILGKVPSGNL